MFILIYIEHRNAETRKTLTTSQFRYETFYYLWVKRVFNMRKREAQSFYDDFSICTPPTTKTPAVKPRRAPKINRLLRTLKLHSTDFFSNPSPRFRCVTSLTSLVIFTICDFYCDISEWHVRSARAWTPALMFALSRKVLSLTKPKSKIYKTKSLGHYITLARVILWGYLPLTFWDLS